jgi:hypothetical protein
MIFNISKIKAVKKAEPVTITWQGMNRKTLIADNEISGGSNLSMTLHNPLISNRGHRELLYTLATPKALFSANGKLVWVEGTTFKYNNTTEGTVTATAKSMVDFNGKILIFPDKKQYDYGTDTFGDMTDSGALGTVPDIDFACVHMNRVVGVKGNNIYICKQGDATNWTTYDTTSITAFATDVESEGGSFTGIKAYQNHAVLFKRDIMFELYNNKSPFTVQRVNEVGCISNLAIQEVDSVLYFVGSEGVYAYTGGMPRLISDKLDEQYTDATLGTDGRLLYVSLNNGTAWKTYAYDTMTGVWMPEDSSQVVQFTRIQDNAYALMSDGKLYKLNSGTEIVTSEIYTKDYTGEIFKNKGLGMVHIRADLNIGTQFKVYVSYDGGSYSLIESVIAPSTGIMKFKKSLKIKMADRFKIKITVVGDFKLYGFGTEVIVGEA